MKIGPSEQNIAALSFEKLVEFLHKDDVCKVTSACIERVLSLASKILSGEKVKKVNNMRKFMSCFFIVCFPQKCFHGTCPELETSIVEKSKKMIEDLEMFLMGLANGKTLKSLSEPLRSFVDVLNIYMELFDNWKDATRPDVQASYLQMFERVYGFGRTTPMDHVRMSRFQKNIDTHRERFSNICGKDALEKFEINNPRPIACNPLVADASLLKGEGLFGTISPEQLAHQLLVFPKTYFASKGNDSINPPCVPLENENTTPPIESILDDIKSPSKDMSRLCALVKEIEKGIPGLKEIPEMPQTYQLQDCMHVFHILYNALFRAQHHLDPTHLATRWALAKSTISSLSFEEGICHNLRVLYELFQETRLVNANYNIYKLGPVVTAHGIDYEQFTFGAKVQSGEITLERTKAWLQDLLRVVPFTPNHTPNRYLVMAILRTVFCKMNPDKWPETLQFDMDILAHMHKEFRYAVWVSTVLVTMSKLCGDNFGAAAYFSTMKAESDKNIIFNRASGFVPPKDAHTLVDLLQKSNETEKMVIKQIQRIYINIDLERTVADSIIGVLGLFLYRIQRNIETVRSVIKVHSKVHGPRYSQLISELSRKVQG